jgi:hypothetical protein
VPIADMAKAGANEPPCTLMPPKIVPVLPTLLVPPVNVMALAVIPSPELPPAICPGLPRLWPPLPDPPLPPRTRPVLVNVAPDAVN